MTMNDNSPGSFFFLDIFPCLLYHNTTSARSLCRFRLKSVSDVSFLLHYVPGDPLVISGFLLQPLPVIPQAFL